MELLFIYSYSYAVTVTTAMIIEIRQNGTDRVINGLINNDSGSADAYSSVNKYHWNLRVFYSLTAKLISSLYRINKRD